MAIREHNEKALGEPRAFSWFGVELVAEEQNACRLLFAAAAIVGADRAIEELVLVEVDLEERRAREDLAGDQGF
jgi:hypothetical protein